MKVIINRSKWLRGTSSPPSFLVRYSDGMLCCLGFLGVACGIEQEAMIGRTSPSDVFGHFHKWPKGTFLDNCHQLGTTKSYLNGPTIISIIKNNDDPSISDDLREVLISNDFTHLGVEVTFED